MRLTTPTLAASLAFTAWLALAASLALTGAVLAQAPAGGPGSLDLPVTGDRPTMGRSTGPTMERLPESGAGSTTNPAMVPPGAGPAGTGMPPGTGGTAGGPGGINR